MHIPGFSKCKYQTLFFICRFMTVLFKNGFFCITMLMLSGPGLGQVDSVKINRVLKPEVYVVDQKMRKDFWKIEFLYIEALAVTGVLNTTAVNLTNR